MPASYQTYTANGSTASFGVPFPYLHRNHVFVGVNGAQVPFTWDNDSSVRPVSVPLAGQTVEVRRFTPTSTPPIDFANGAVLAEDTLDILARYCAYLAEETREGTSGAGGSWTPYTLPIASPTELGGVKIGSGISRAPDGTISASGGTTSPPYSLPPATTTQLGGIRVGANLTVTPDGTLNAPAPSTGGAAPLGGVTIPNFSMDINTPQGLVKFPDTNPAGWNTGIGKMTFDTEILFSNYFAVNPVGHIAIALRNTSSLLMTGGAVRGQGVAIGYLTPPGVDHTPVAMLESWFNPYPPGPGPANTLPKFSEAGPGVPIKDNTPYRLIVEASKANDGNRYIRMRLYTKNTDQTPNQWVSVHDTGDVLDINTVADLTQSGLGLGHVIESGAGGWSIQFTNCKVTWGPATDALPDLRARLSRYGGELEGNVAFKNPGLRVRLKVDGPAYTNNWTIFEPSTDNTNGSVVTRPTGTARAAGFAATNSPSTVNYGSIGLNILSDKAVLTSISVGTEPTRPIDILVQGTTVARFSTGGVTILGASQPLGTPGRAYGGYSMDGVNARDAADKILDWDDLCTTGRMVSYYHSLGADIALEAACRPLYGALGRLITDLRARKII